jgi:protein TonB
MRQRAPGSTKIAGVSTTMMVMALAGYALMNGIGGQIMSVIQPPTIVAMLPPVEPEQKVEDISWETDVKLTMPEPDWRPEEFDTERKSSITLTAGPEVKVALDPIVVATAMKSPILAPKLLKAAAPPYPIASVRAQEHGTTGLEVCVDATGRVTSASLTQTSGHTRLDEAALKWVRGARFAPGRWRGAGRVRPQRRLRMEA